MMRKAEIFMHGVLAGYLIEKPSGHCNFKYQKSYNGEPISLTMPILERDFSFDSFPPFFEGLLPEGIMLDGLLRQLKIDRNDFFSQLIATGEDLVGAVTVKKMTNE